jgi:Ser/Thr protein kinase RdoA (MazF antagonist)
LSAIERGESLVDGGVIDRLPHDPVGELAREARRLAQTLAPVARRQIESWRDRTVPQQWCLGDVRAEHFLFVGHRVTGVLDFGAAHVESIAGDLARLLTETIGAAAPLRDLVLSEYTAVRPTTSVEIQSIEVFAAATLPVALARWLEWLFDVPDGNPLPDWDSREVVRLRRLVALC